MRESKYNPINRLGKDNIVVLGIAYDEQQRVQKDSTIKYPLIEWKWTEQDCVDYLNKKGLLNPLYMNFNRLGCYWCPKQGSGSLYVMWKNYPKLWEKMKEMEKWQYKNKGIKLYSKDLMQIEMAFKLGHKPKKLPKYGCSHGCESVKRAFEERQCNLNSFDKK
jgi:3'-phosphoadenosine 5'-phosphosulfate sulfotransferase (PAPS reductase)/FAD synthetase